jgi:hypothetical protein
MGKRMDGDVMSRLQDGRDRPAEARHTEFMHNLCRYMQVDDRDTGEIGSYILAYRSSPCDSASLADTNNIHSERYPVLPNHRSTQQVQKTKVVRAKKRSV